MFFQTGTRTKIPSYIGSCAMFYLEHIIKPTANYPLIKVFGQIDFTLGMWIELPQARKTPPAVIQDFIDITAE